ncbi:MAG: hypothetical protein RhofKO_19470 [Rhodothermales bacterium]
MRPTGLLVWVLLVGSAYAQAQPPQDRIPASVAPVYFVPSGEAIRVFNLPVTAQGYDVTQHAILGDIEALDVILRPETATVFGFRLGTHTDSLAFNLAYDLTSQELYMGGTELLEPFALHHPLVNNALRIRLWWNADMLRFLVDDTSYRMPLTTPAAPRSHVTLFVDHGMIQATHLTAWLPR